ncbi:MAG: DAK2 domain-containing protein [Actinobacteria bacterium]|nr:DAK2 domain-containing protein [Actinomycetota bacterium]MCL6095038.1 DAK2 domain-containing protein [Actinomycetota bacterium]
MTVPQSASEVVDMLICLAHLVEDTAEELGALDASLGDGDLGVTMRKGFTAIETKLSDPELSVVHPGDVLVLAGTTMASVAPSTLGTLLGFGFVKAGKKVADKESLDGAAWSVIWRTIVDSIATQGKAQRGDKTILDALVPGAEAFDSALERGDSVEEAALEAYVAARQGFEDTARMQARQGRAGRYYEHSVGYKDAGARMGALIFQAFSRSEQAS